MFTSRHLKLFTGTGDPVADTAESRVLIDDEDGGKIETLPTDGFRSCLTEITANEFDNLVAS